MEIKELVQNMSERLQTSASVKAVYGDPIETQGKTIVPVARVCYGFGAGGGHGKCGDNDDEGEGLGAGGGVSATPAGLVEITPEETLYKPFGQKKKLIGVGLGCLAIGFAIGALSSWCHLHGCGSDTAE